MVRDHCLLDGDTPKSVTLHQAKSWAPVYWCGQPTAKELESIVKVLENESYPVSVDFLVCMMRIPIKDKCNTLATKDPYTSTHVDFLVIFM